MHKVMNKYIGRTKGLQKERLSSTLWMEALSLLSNYTGFALLWENSVCVCVCARACAILIYTWNIFYININIHLKHIY